MAGLAKAYIKLELHWETHEVTDTAGRNIEICYSSRHSGLLTTKQLMPTQT